MDWVVPQNTEPLKELVKPQALTSTRIDTNKRGKNYGSQLAKRNLGIGFFPKWLQWLQVSEPHISLFFVPALPTQPLKHWCSYLWGRGTAPQVPSTGHPSVSPLNPQIQNSQVYGIMLYLLDTEFHLQFNGKNGVQYLYSNKGYGQKMKNWK